MWGSFLFAIASLAVILYVPAAFALRGFGARRALAVCAAPLVSATVISILPVVYAMVGLRSSGLTVVGPLLAIGFVGLVVGLVKMGPRKFFLGGSKPFSSLAFAACLAIGVIASALLCVAPLGQPAAFVQGNDIAHHLNQAKAFLDSGNWSMLNGTLNPDEPGSYYPSLWAVLTALLSDYTGASVTLSANVVNALVAGILFPTSLYLLSSVVFDGKRRMIVLCGVCGVLFFGMPWQLFMRSALLYPNAVGLALLPSAAAVIGLAADSFFKQGEGTKTQLGYFGLALIGVACLGLAHPNTVFSLYVFMVPFGAWRLASGLSEKGFSLTRKFAFVVLYLLGAVALWVAMTKISFLEPIVTYPYGKSGGVLESLLANLAFNTSYAGAQYVLGAIVLLGFAGACWKKEYRWLACSYALAFVLCVVNMSLPDCDIKHLVSGFWYNHPVRLAAMKALFAAPLAALGFDLLISLVASLFGKLGVAEKIRTSIVPVVVSVVLLAFALVVPLPLPHAGTFQGYAANMVDYNTPNGSKSFLVQDEQDFLKEVKGVVDPQKPILNVAHDGSAFAYALEGLNITNRSFYAGVHAQGDLKLLDTKIDQIASNEEVREAAARLNIGYVLVLDQPGQKGATIYSNRFEKEDWSGLYGVSENKPGFTLLLSKGDMKLYEVSV